MLTKSDYSLIYSYLRLAQLRAQRIAERSRNADTRREQLRRCRELTHLLEKISGTPIDPPARPGRATHPPPYADDHHRHGGREATPEAGTQAPETQGR